MEIKKIYIPQSTAIDTSELWGGINDNVLAAKINELIDIVNKQQDIIRQIGEWGSKKGECLWCDTLTEFNPEKPTISKKEKVEPKIPTEQTKWIGCVCRFWYENPENTTLDYLEKVKVGEDGLEYYGKETYDWYPHCEPILPTDKAIYKGGKDG